MLPLPIMGTRKSDNLFQDMLDDDFIKIFKPVHTMQKCLGFQRVQVKHNFVTSVSTQSQLYAGALIFFNIIFVADVVINCETTLKTSSADETLKLCLILNAIVTNLAICTNNFSNGNLNSMIYVKLQKLDRQLIMENKRLVNRKIASLSLFLTTLGVTTALVWITVLNIVTMKMFYPSIIFAIITSMGNYLEILLCILMLLYLIKRVDFLNKVLQASMKKRPKLLSNLNDLATVTSGADGFRIDVVIAMHNILDIISDFIKLFQFHVSPLYLRVLCNSIL
ncbi:uncharacterized protein LOC132901875 [Amyelois transitella]|uniref:uncharacterized protein LOC132901875 n=1 Tax=Amyelois transitella TaxID=680683 RepID=UPI0029907DE4|nr:uncharacterized protein LOC132901875 [Amyelois transitella]